MSTAIPSFELRNAGVGPDPLSLDEIAERVDFAILLLLRDAHCPKCKQQVQRVGRKAGKVQRRDTAVVPVLPEGYETALEWSDRYDLPIPLLADPAGAVGDSYDQPRRFGALGRLHDFIGRMPKAITLDLRGAPEIVESYEGSTPSDRPTIEELLEAVDDLRESFVFDCELVNC